jgi:DNA polymerase-3 subunit beta
MKITTLQENLKNGLFFTSHVAGKNINLPILNNVMIKAESGTIKLVTTDLEVGVVATVRGKVEKEGVFTVDAKIISEYISLLPNQKVEIIKKDNSLFIKSGNYKTTIKGQNAEEFPLIPQVDKKYYYRVDATELRQALNQVIFAVSTNETRIELSGVLFDFNKKTLTLAATDSYRLAEKTVPLFTNSENNRQIIVPAKTLQELTRILGALNADGEEKIEVNFYISENQILFAVGSIELVSRLIEGQYPDYKQIIPNTAKTTAVINRVELIRAIKAAAIFSKSGINDINLDFPLGKNKITITSTSGQVGENIIDLPADVSGQDNGIVINYRYLLDGVNIIDSENIRLEIINSSTPCLLKPEKDKSFFYVVMPIKQ